MPALYQLEQATVIRVIRLQQGIVTIGRDPDNTIVLNNPHVSRFHCRVILSGHDASVEDLRSRNGTWMCGRQIGQQNPLIHGARMQIGHTVFVYRAEDAKTRTVATSSEPSSHDSLHDFQRNRRIFRIRVRWRFGWDGFAFGWRIHRI